MTVRFFVMLAMLPFVAACGSDRVPVAILYAQEAEGQLRISVDTCQGNPELGEVTKSPSAVEVTVISDDQSGEGPRPACADHVNVQLDEPLGERKLIDGTTGERVEVR